MNRALRLAGIAALTVLLASCSLTKLAYNKLDWLASWKVGDYIQLDGPAEELFEARFAAAWKWHRQTQLPLYAADLRELAETTAQPMSREQVDRVVSRAQAHGDAIVEKILPDWAAVLAALNDEQVAGFRKRLAENHREQAEEIARGEHWDRREKRLEGMLEGMKDWLGSYTPEQEALAEAWAGELRYNPELRQAIRTESNQRFMTLMAARREPGFGERLMQMVREPQTPSSVAIKALQAHNRNAGVAVLSELSATLSQKQRQHLRDELLGLASDLEELAAEQVD